nr:ATP-dependent RNA helicase DDX24 [Paratrimastix eleionoma]
MAQFPEISEIKEIDPNSIEVFDGSSPSSPSLSPSSSSSPSVKGMTKKGNKNNKQQKKEIQEEEEEETMKIKKKTRKIHGTGHPLLALILTPTRELAIQISEHLHRLFKFTSIKVVPLVGGISSQKQERLLATQPEVVVGTPGRIWDIIQQGNRHLNELENLRVLVLDEADRMVEQGHFAELKDIFQTLPPFGAIEVEGPNGKMMKVDPTVRRQTFLFSATLCLPPNLRKGKGGKFNTSSNSNNHNNDDEEEEHQHSHKKTLSRYQHQHEVGRRGCDGRGDGTTGKRSKKNGNDETSSTLTENRMEQLMRSVPFGGVPVIIDITRKGQTAATLQQRHVLCSVDDKDVYLVYFLVRHPGRSLVFVNSIQHVKKLTSLCQLMKIHGYGLHANMQQRQRLKNLERFRQEKECVLVASDVAARGLDIPLVDHVIHYHLSRSPDVYIHRSGRTARAGQEGYSLMLVSPEEMKTYQEICKTLGGAYANGVPRLSIEPSYFPNIRKRIGLVHQIQLVEGRTSKETSEMDWFTKTAEQADLPLDDELMEQHRKFIDVESGQAIPHQHLSQRRSIRHNAGELQQLKSELLQLTKQPLLPKELVKNYPTAIPEVLQLLLGKHGRDTGSNTGGEGDNNRNKSRRDDEAAAGGGGRRGERSFSSSSSSSSKTKPSKSHYRKRRRR